MSTEKVPHITGRHVHNTAQHVPASAKQIAGLKRSEGFLRVYEDLRKLALLVALVNWRLHEAVPRADQLLNRSGAL